MGIQAIRDLIRDDKEYVLSEARKSNSLRELVRNLNGGFNGQISQLLTEFLTKELGTSITTVFSYNKKKKSESVFDDTALLRKAADGANSLSDIIERMGLLKSGGNYKTLKRAMLNAGLDYTALSVKGRANSARGSKKRIDLDEAFSEKGRHDRSTLKGLIIKHSLLPYVCAVCKLNGLWQGKPLVLHLEHKNGVNTDNRLSNLEFLCPNCHSQTATYAGRNNKGITLKQRKQKVRAAIHTE